MEQLREIFFGRLANFFRERSRKRRQYGHRRAVAPRRREMRLEALEPRLLLSADLAPLPPQAPEAVVFVDSRVVDAAGLAATFGSEVILLDAHSDGVLQVAQALSERSGLSAVHIVSHGIAGRVTLGSAELDAQSLELHAEALRTWGAALAEDGDLLFYGCSIAEGDAGTELVDGIAALTGADVAASIDMTGAAAFGGDWALEYESGVVDAAVLDAPEYAYLLAPDLTAITAAPSTGSPQDPLQAGANVRQTIVLTGTGFTAASQVLFPTIDQNGTLSTVAVQVVQAAADGTSARVVVPDTARTGNITVAGGTGSRFLQIVPTLVDLDLTSASFGAGSNFVVLGSGFTEGNVIIQFGATAVVDTSVSAGPDVTNRTIGAGFDRATNDAITFTIPAGMATGPVTIETAGGRSAALPIVLSQVQALALSGTPATGAQPSANAGQTIRILGNGFDATTEILFPTLTSAGAAGNVAVLPDFVDVAGTLMEVRVPINATTGNLQVVGAAGSFALQVVPTLELARLGTGAQNLRLLGTGLIEGGAQVRLQVGAGPVTTLSDTGTNIDVFSEFGEDNTLAYVTAGTAAAVGAAVSVTTAGGTSAQVTIALEDSPALGSINDFAIFPPGTPDAGRYLVADGTATLKVLDPVTLAQVRLINAPGVAHPQQGIAFLHSDIMVQGTLVPAGSLMVVAGLDTPDRLYFLNPAGAGTVLQSVALAGVTPIDMAGGFALTHHAARGTLFVMRAGTDLVSEVDPATGRALRSFHIQNIHNTPHAGLAVHPERDTLLVANANRIYEVDAESGQVLGNYDPITNQRLGSVDVRQQGVQFDDGSAHLNALAFDAAGNLWGATFSQGHIVDLVLPGQITAIEAGGSFDEAAPVLSVAVDGTPIQFFEASANAGQSILIRGSGFNRFTEVEFEHVNAGGARGFLRVRADAVSADGNALEVMVPHQAVTGEVRISGAPGSGPRLQVTPVIRGMLPSDQGINFDVPLEQVRWGFFGSGLVEGATAVIMGGALILDESASTLVDVIHQVQGNDRLDLTVPERALAGPLTVFTAGGFFTAPSVPLREEVGVALTGITGVAASQLQGTPANPLLAAAHTGQTITLHGSALTLSSLVVFRGVAEDGTRSEIVVQPVSVAGGGTSAQVIVPDLAVTGAVRVSGASASVQLQIVPTLAGASATAFTPGQPLGSTSTFTPGQPMWLMGTGIPRGGPGPGEEVVYSFGGTTSTDTGAPPSSASVQSALGNMLALQLAPPAGASGDTITVTTAGGTASLRLTELQSTTVSAEPQGTGAVDDVGQTLTTAEALPLAPSAALTVTGRLNAANDVDLYRLVGAERGGVLSVSTNGQAGAGRFRLFNELGQELIDSVASLSRVVLPPAAEYYLGYSANANNNYDVESGSGAINGANPGDYTLSLRYADPATTSLTSIEAGPVMGTPRPAQIAAAHAGGAIELHGAGFTANTRVVVSTFNGNSPQNGIVERELTPLLIDATTLAVMLPSDVVTGVVRLADERAGLVVEIVPTIANVDVTSTTTYQDGSPVTITGSGFAEGGQHVTIGTTAFSQMVQDVWDFTGPDAVNSGALANAGLNFSLGREPLTGPFYVTTLGGSSAAFERFFTGFATNTVADRGTPANTAVASANVREAVVLDGFGFDMGTEVIFTTHVSSQDVRSTRIVTPTSVSADRSRMTVIVPDDAATGLVRVMGAEHAHFLQIVPTIVQVIPPASFATGNTITIQGSGFIEGEAIIGVGPTELWDTGMFFGPDAFNSAIPLAGFDRTDNDGLSLSVPPSGANGPWFVTTSGGTARFGLVVNLGVVVQETRTGRTVAPGEQELFTATAAVQGWMDFDVTFTSPNQADVVVQLADGTDAPLVEYRNEGGVVHIRVAALDGQSFILRTNGVGAVASYDVVVTNQDRFDDPVGPAQGTFGGNYGADPDGRNDDVGSATGFVPASHVTEPRLTLTPGESDWFTWTAQASGSLDIGALFAASAGPLAFNVYDEGGLVATSSAAADGARVSGVAAIRGERFWIETFGTTATAKAEYTFTFSNRDAIDAVAPGNDVIANAMDLGWDVAWNSVQFADMLTIHQPTDQDWFRLRAGVTGTLRVLVDNEFPNLGHIAVNVRDAATLANLSQQFVDLGSRLEYTFAPVLAGQSLLVQFTGQPNSYSFSIQNEDRLEDNQHMGQPANRGAIVHDRVAGLSLPGLPDAGTRDDDWFRIVSPARDSRFDVSATPSPQFGGDVTVRIWRDADGDSIADAGEMLTEGTSVAGGSVTLQVATDDNQALYVQVFDPASGPFTGVAYDIDFAHVDRFDRVDAAGAANNTAATATDLGAVVGVVEDQLTLLPFDADWFSFTTRAEDGWLDVNVGAEGDAVLVEVWRDATGDGIADTLVRSGTGRDVRLEDIAADSGQRFWVRTELLNAANPAAAGALVRVQVTNHDRFDDPVGDGIGGFVNNPPTGNDPDGGNNGPRTTGATVEGTLRLVQPDPDVPATFQGHIGVSTDGLGTFTTGNLQADIPAGSTIELALLYVTTRSFEGPYRPSEIGFESTGVALQVLPNVDNATGVDFETLRADVTGLVAARVGSSGGVFNFAVDERLANGGLSDEDADSAVEGTALVVIYSNPTLPIRSIAVLEGGLSGPATQTTRLLLSNPVDKTHPDFIAQLRLGIGFGFQPDGQFSTVSVNGSRMTSSAGNFDDGSAANGTLVTVGGVGDNPATPASPTDTTNTSDDELYNLAAFLTNGDREIVLDTANPSDDDSIFLAVLMVAGEASLGGILTDLGDVGQVTENGLTLPAADQDWYRIRAVEVGDMSATIDFAPGGSASALMYRDADDDNLPDDLNADGVPDSAGIISIEDGRLLISQIPARFVGDTFLLRVFDPVGQVEYDLDVRVNQHPEAFPDFYSVDEDAILSVSAEFGVLDNDVDGDFDPLTATLTSGVSHGALAFNPDGSFTYTPHANYFGPDSFSYSVADGFGGVDSSTVLINVLATNDVPVAADDAYSTDEDTALVIHAPGVIFNDSDVDGTSLTSILVSGPSNAASFDFGANGGFNYTPGANFYGTDTFTYKVNDGTDDSNVATVTITVNPVNDAPVAVNDTNTTDENTAVVGDVLANDTDVEPGNLAVASVNGEAANVGSTITLASGALLRVNADGSYSYDPNGAFAFVREWQSATDSFSYTAADSEGGVSNTATVTVTVTGVNDAPAVAIDKTVDADGDGFFASSESVPEGGDQIADYRFVVTNASTASTDPLTVIELFDNRLGNLMGEFLAANDGSTTLGVGQSVTFFVRDVVLPAFVGISHSNVVTITAVDDEGTQTEATDIAAVTYVNVAPAITIDKRVDANRDSLLTSSESVLEGGAGNQMANYHFVLTNTSAASTDPLNVQELSDDQLGDLMPVFVAANGSSIIGAGQSVTFMVVMAPLPVQNAGTAHVNTVTVRAVDDDGDEGTPTQATDSATVTYADAAPAIVLDKTVDADGDGLFASSESVLEGAVGDQSVDYQFVVTNASEASTDPLTVNALLDDQLGDLMDEFLAANGGSATLGFGQSVTFFVRDVLLPVRNAGSSHDNTVTVTAVDDENGAASAADSASVTYENVATPTLALDKTVDADEDGVFASFEFVSEGGFGNQAVDYRFVLSNTSAASTDPLTLTELSDDKLGDLMSAFIAANGGSAVLGAGQSVTFFVHDFLLPAQNAFTTHDNTAAALAMDDEGSLALAEGFASVAYVNANPDVTIDKRVDADEDGVFNSSESVFEGGFGNQAVDYKFVVTNASAASTDPLTVSELTDNQLGDLMDEFVAANGGSATLGFGQSVTFFVRDVLLPVQNAGASHLNGVTVRAGDDETSLTGAAALATDFAIVTYADLAPAIALDKAVDANGDGVFASSESVLEGGAGDHRVDYRFVVTNASGASTDPLTVTELSDDRLGDLMAEFLAANAGSGTLGVGQSVTFFVRDAVVPPQNAGSSHDNTVMVTAADDESSVASATDSASVSYANVATPTLTVDKAVDADADGIFSASESVLEGGVGDQSVDYRFVVSNASAASTDPLTLTALFDDKLGDLLAAFQAANGGSVTLDVGQSVTFFVHDVVLPVQNAGASHANTVMITAFDDENSGASAVDSANVSYANVDTPTIVIDKAVDADGDGVFSASESLLEGGAGDQSVDYRFVLTNTSSATTDPLILTNLFDDQLGDLLGYFRAAKGGSVTVISVTLEVGEAVTFFVHDVVLPVQNAGASHDNTVTVTAVDDESSVASATDTASVSYANVATPTIVIDKAVDADGDGLFNASESLLEGGVGDQGVDYRFVVSNTSTASTDPLTLIELFDDQLGDLLGLFRGANGGGVTSLTLDAGQTVTFFVRDVVLPVQNAGASHDNTVTVTAADDESSVASAADTASVSYANVATPTIALDKAVDADEDGVFANGEFVFEGGFGDQAVDYQFVLSNTSTASTDPLTVTELLDDQVGDLMSAFLAANGGSAVIDVGQTVTFFVHDFVVPAQNAGTVYMNTATARAADDEGSLAFAEDVAFVAYANQSSTIAIDKSVDADEDGLFSDAEFVFEGGFGNQAVDYRFVVSNTSEASTDPVTVTALSDDKLGDLTDEFLAANGGSAVIGVGETVTFFVRNVVVPVQNVGASHDNVATVAAVDDENSMTFGFLSDSARVFYANVTPAILLDKAVDADEDGVFAGSESVYEGGFGDQAVDYQFVLRNTSTASTDPLMLAELFDDKLGDLMDEFLAANGGSATLGAGQTVTFFVHDFLLPVQNAGASHVNTAVVIALDDDGDVTHAADIATVTYVNAAPVAGADTFTTAEDTALTVSAPGVLGNDVDAGALSAVLVETTEHGLLTFNADGSFSYTPVADFNGIDSFTYQASDGSLSSDVATVTITVTAVNDAPVATPDAYSVNEDNTLTVPAAGVLGNDTDVDNTSLTAVLVSGPGNGSLTLNSDGSLSYTPNADFHGTDTFTYRANDGTDDSNVAAVTITVNAVNDAPAAVADAYSVNEDNALTVPVAGVLGNDTDVEGSALTAALVSGTSNGSLALNANGSFTYTPNLNFNGTDTFTYRANDGGLNSNVATVTITINAVNDAPVAVDDSAITDQNVAVTVPVLANDTDVDSALTVTAANAGANGTVSVNANGTVTYTPNAGFAGTDTFEYTVSDGSLTDTGLVTVTVRGAAATGIDVEKYVKLASRQKGNEGVGNGDDPPPPGHDFNQNDGPGTGPGNPGSKGGQDHQGHDDDDHGHGGGGNNDDDDYGLDADTAPGLSARIGDKVTFTYVVTNTGSIAISNVRVVDDNETPGVTGDDFSPSAVNTKKGFNVGDLDRDRLLDPGEVWLYTWTTKVTAGEHVNVATASGTLVGGGAVADADPAHWVGIDPSNAAIGNLVWSDKDADGIQDAGEDGIRGVRVNLLDANSVVVASTVTDSQGRYQFGALAAGTYTVQVASSNFATGGALAGRSASPRDRGGSDAKDSDLDPVTLRSAPIVLDVGEKDTSVDFGFRKTAGSPPKDCDRRDDDRDHRWPDKWTQDCVITPSGHGSRGDEQRRWIDWLKCGW